MRVGVSLAKAQTLTSMNTTSAKTKSRASLCHESHQADNKLTALQLNRDFANIILRPSDPDVEWSGDFSVEPWIEGSKELSRLSYRGIHPVPLTTYGLDLRTGARVEGDDWTTLIEKEQKDRAWYRRASGKGWDPTEGVHEMTVTYRPDLLMVLKLEADPKLTEAWMDSNLPKIASYLESLAGELQCKLIMAHNAKSINHVHPRIFSVDDDGKLLWPRLPNGKMPGGKKGLNLLQPGKLAIMRLVRAGIVTGDDAAERAYNNRCRACSSKYSNGLPLDWSATVWLDNETERFIASLGPKAVQTAKLVKEDYKKWIDGKMAASPYNLKGQNKELKARVESLEAMVRDLVQVMKNPPAAKPEPEFLPRQSRLDVATEIWKRGHKVMLIDLETAGEAKGTYQTTYLPVGSFVVTPDKKVHAYEDITPLDHSGKPIANWKTVAEREAALMAREDVRENAALALKLKATGKPVDDQVLAWAERVVAHARTRPVDERADEGYDIAPPRASPQPVLASPRAPEPEVVAEPSDWPEFRKIGQQAIPAPKPIVEAVLPPEPAKRKKPHSEMTTEEQVEDLLADLAIELS